MSKALETYVIGEDNNLNLDINLTLVYCAFPGICL